MHDNNDSGAIARDLLPPTASAWTDAGSPLNILSVDVEDWFHLLDVEGTPSVNSWSQLEFRVERNFETLLEQFAEHKATATCFFLGWIAERFPHLVRKACEAGHEIASHGYSHQLVYTQSREEFRTDVERSRLLLEDLSGTAVAGFRAPGFSITADTPWALEELVRAGYRYDSSLFPATREHGGLAGGERAPHFIETEMGTLIEFPISVANLMGKDICFFGGGYLRFFPIPVIRRMASQVNREGRPVVYYVHPREIDPDHPRLPMSRFRHFKSYVNLSTTKRKLDTLLREQSLVSFRDWMVQRSPAR